MKADDIFADPKLAEIYDLLDSPDRHDLDPYVGIANEFNTKSIIDFGCGTGILACRLAANGKKVIGIDPAGASLEVAKRRENAKRVSWIQGSTEQLKGLRTDLIVMTGNVAQVFITDKEWVEVLQSCRDVLNIGGHFIFEVRDISKEAWKGWTKEQTYMIIESPEVGIVEFWSELVNVQLPLVTFRHNFIFQKEGSMKVSESTLCFRSKSEIMNSLSDVGFIVDPIRDAPDRPGLEFVFVAHV